MTLFDKIKEVDLEEENLKKSKFYSDSSSESSDCPDERKQGRRMHLNAHHHLDNMSNLSVPRLESDEDFLSDQEIHVRHRIRNSFIFCTDTHRYSIASYWIIVKRSKPNITRTGTLSNCLNQPARN